MGKALVKTGRWLATTDYQKNFKREVFQISKLRRMN